MASSAPCCTSGNGRDQTRKVFLPADITIVALEGSGERMDVCIVETWQDHAATSINYSCLWTLEPRDALSWPNVRKTPIAHRHCLRPYSLKLDRVNSGVCHYQVGRHLLSIDPQAADRTRDDRENSSRPSTRG
jgi:hypothetical protein